MVYAATTIDTQIIDVSDPAEPSIVGTFDSSRGVVGFGDRIVVLSNDVLRVLDNTTPSTPVEIGSLMFDYTLNDIELSADGTTAYVASEGVDIVNLTDPSNPVIAGAYSFGEFEFVNDLSRTAAGLFATHNSDAVLLDVADPATPTIVGIHTIGLAFLTDLAADAVRPDVVASVDVPGNGAAMTMGLDHLYVAEGGTGFVSVFDAFDIFDIQPLTRFQAEGTFRRARRRAVGRYRRRGPSTPVRDLPVHGDDGLGVLAGQDGVGAAVYGVGSVAATAAPTPDGSARNGGRTLAHPGSESRSATTDLRAGIVGWSPRIVRASARISKSAGSRDSKAVRMWTALTFAAALMVPTAPASSPGRRRSSVPANTAASGMAEAKARRLSRSPELSFAPRTRSGYASRRRPASAALTPTPATCGML
jgi:hypothetical protein